MQVDGTPAELFLPWRTTATAISGGEYLGQMQLPGGSINHVFVRDGEAILEKIRADVGRAAPQDGQVEGVDS
jgi:hypothetical protein